MEIKAVDVLTPFKMFSDYIYLFICIFLRLNCFIESLGILVCLFFFYFYLSNFFYLGYFDSIYLFLALLWSVFGFVDINFLVKL